MTTLKEDFEGLGVDKERFFKFLIRCAAEVGMDHAELEMHFLKDVREELGIEMPIPSLYDECAKYYGDDDAKP